MQRTMSPLCSQSVVDRQTFRGMNIIRMLSSTTADAMVTGDLHKITIEVVWRIGDSYILYGYTLSIRYKDTELDR